MDNLENKATQPEGVTTEQPEASGVTRTSVPLDEAPIDTPPTNPENPEQPTEPEKGPEQETNTTKDNVDLPILDTEEPKEKEPEDTPSKPPVEEIMEDLQALAIKDEVTDEDLAPFIEKGFTKTELMLIVKGARAELKEAATSLYETVGGEETYKQIVDWGNQNLSLEEKKEFNEVMMSRNPAVMKWAMLGLKAKYEAANSGPAYVTGNASTKAPIQPFQSREEMAAALTDKKRMRDPAYREYVYQRALISNF